MTSNADKFNVPDLLMDDDLLIDGDKNVYDRDLHGDGNCGKPR
jgi:hypothetical protein